MEQQPKTQTIQHTNRWLFALQIGVFAGLIWGFVYFASHYFHFTKTVPSLWTRPFFPAPFVDTIGGIIAGWLLFIFLSLFAAEIYAWLFAKVKGPWIGLAYGLAWWLLYAVLGPVLGITKGIAVTDRDTILTDLCLFTMWGFFIGFSITYEFTDEKLSEPTVES